VLPLLEQHLAEKVDSVAAYQLLYHEAALANLLEVPALPLLAVCPSCCQSAGLPASAHLPLPTACRGLWASPSHLMPAACQ
jgi:hypothetical protein